MLVKQTKAASHNKPIYFVELQPTNAGTLLVTNTECSDGAIGPDGFPIQYRQTINLQTGACTCACTGFQNHIARRAARERITPSIHNDRTCKHIRKAAQCGAEWGYLEPTTNEPQTNDLPESATAPIFDYVSFFEAD